MGSDSTSNKPHPKNQSYSMTTLRDLNVQRHEIDFTGAAVPHKYWNTQLKVEHHLTTLINFRFSIPNVRKKTNTHTNTCACINSKNGNSLNKSLAHHFKLIECRKKAFNLIRFNEHYQLLRNNEICNHLTAQNVHTHTNGFIFYITHFTFWTETERERGKRAERNEFQ